MTLMRRTIQRTEVPARWGDLDLLFNQFFATPERVLGDRNGGGVFAPPIELIRKDSELILRADVPGIAKDAIEVTIHDEAITLSGKRATEEDNTEGETRYNERTWSEFSRTVRLPVPVEPGEARAELKDGVLEIRIPIASEAKPHRIEINQN